MKGYTKWTRKNSENNKQIYLLPKEFVLETNNFACFSQAIKLHRFMVCIGKHIFEEVC